MKSATSNETQTQTVKEDVNAGEEKDFWSRFCHKHGINKNLVMLKITLFVMHGGKFCYSRKFPHETEHKQPKEVKNCDELCDKILLCVSRRLTSFQVQTF